MQNMNYYYDFSGQKFGYPLSLSINSFDTQVFARQSSLEISYVLKGEYEVISEHFTSSLKEHELVLIAPNDIHMMHQTGQQENVILTIHIDFACMAGAMVGNNDKAFESLICTKQQNFKLLMKLKQKIGSLLHVVMRKDKNLFELNVLMMELIYIASNHQQFPIEHLPFQEVHHENYMKAIRYIDEHYKEELYLEDLANTLSFSISYTSKLFKKYTRISFVKYLSYVRIRASMEAILEGKRTIEEIAATFGLPNSKAYTTAFKDLYGITPSLYRKRFIKNITINDSKKEQVLSIDEKTSTLLEHLLLALEDTLYENAGIKIVNKDHHIICHINQSLATQTTLTHTKDELCIDIKK
ncbi:helix-turn-helix transcriptional regulator [Anaerorhabdus sp.]|uniref:helix-turn-helix transcriptional regulator n=1 Tax=Anaerorhabdus sp. TaxID=1872524 RepID=UPI002FC640F0